MAPCKNPSPGPFQKPFPWLAEHELLGLAQVGSQLIAKGKMCDAGRETGNMSRNLVKGGHFLHLYGDSGSPLQSTPSLSLNSS